MALTVETGTGSATSEAYDTVANANTYYDNRGYSDTATEATMRRGTELLDARYRLKLKGFKANSGQALAWPRDGVTDEDGNYISASSIPTAVKYASFEMARAVNTSLELDFEAAIERLKAGSVEVEFAGGRWQRTILSHIDDLMRPYIEGGGKKLVRAG
jgi:hypothetical protein